MNRCPYCKNIVWSWQPHPVSGLHQWCLDTFVKGYAEGLKIATVQAVKFLTEYKKRANSRIPESQTIQ